MPEQHQALFLSSEPNNGPYETLLDAFALKRMSARLDDNVTTGKGQLSAVPSSHVLDHGRPTCCSAYKQQTGQDFLAAGPASTKGTGGVPFSTFQR